MSSRDEGTADLVDREVSQTIGYRLNSSAIR